MFLNLSHRDSLSRLQKAIMEISYYVALIIAPIIWASWGWLEARRIATAATDLAQRSTRKHLEWLWIVPTIALTLAMLYMFRAPLEQMGVLEAYRYPAVYAFSIILLAPMYEEIVFRRLLFRHLTTKTSVFRAAVLSSVVFALLHFGSYPFPIVEFLGGMVFCGLYVWRKTLIALIAAHMAANLAQAIVENYLLR